MKKIFLSLIIIVVLFAATGCGKSTNNSASSELIINGEKIKINEIGTLNDLNYKYSDDFNVESQSSGVNITYIKDTPQFKISWTYAENGSIEDAIKLLAVDEGSKVKINGKTWSAYKKDDNSEVYKIYACEYKNSSYIISFVVMPDSNIDLNNLINTFMNNISYN